MAHMGRQLEAALGASPMPTVELAPEGAELRTPLLLRGDKPPTPPDTRLKRTPSTKLVSPEDRSGMPQDTPRRPSHTISSRTSCPHKLRLRWGFQRPTEPLWDMTPTGPTPGATPS